MRSLFKNRIVVALLLGVLVFVLTSIIVMSIPGLPGLMETRPWLALCVNHTAMWVLSMLTIWMLSGGRFDSYGFKIATDIPGKRIVLYGLGIGIASTIAEPCLAGKGLVPLGDLSFLQEVLLVWLYASISEEILTRGLLQGYLAPLAKHGLTVFRVRISLPVLVSAAFFGFMHLTQLAMGANVGGALIAVFFAFVLGIVAGHYREKTESLIPAILVHVLANAGGSLAGFVLGSLARIG